MRHEIDHVDWHKRLPNTIAIACDGDTIVCRSDSMRELAERARIRMCPDKQLTFELEDSAV